MNPRFRSLQALVLWLLLATGPAGSQPGQVTAREGGVAVGGNLINSNVTINHGMSPEVLKAIDTVSRRTR